jgi:LytR cell envelope-related transcriptional attenuator
MIALPLALSLSSSFTEVGAIAAFAALLGIAILSLLAFSQAREIKRLREWAGRAPERAAEIEQRVSADAAARVQRTGAPAAPARVVPRKTPLVSAPVSTAVNATVAAGRMGAPPTPAPPTPATSPASVPPAPAPAAQSTPKVDEGTPDAQSALKMDGGTPVTAPAAPVASEGERDSTAVEDPVAPTADGAMVSALEKVPAVEPAKPAEELKDATEEPAAPAPATAAARAAAVSARAPLPPSPAAPAPPGAPSSPALAGASAPAVQSPKPASRPPAPVVAARRTPSRTVAASGSDAPPRSPSPSRVRSTSAAEGAGARAASPRASDSPTGASGPKYFKPERSPARTTALIVGGVIVGVLLLVFAVSALKGGGGSTATATQSSSSGEVQPTSSHTTAHATASKPAETAVVVLNGTSTAGLAHHLAADLQQSGYTRAAALAGVPPGTHASTVVEYTHGHRADAQAVAKALNVTQVQAIEPTTASLAGSATVVVLAGADQATQLGGGGAQSKGEPAAGAAGAGSGAANGEAGTGAGSAAGAGEAPAGAGEEGTAGSGH